MIRESVPSRRFSMPGEECYPGRLGSWDHRKALPVKSDGNTTAAVFFEPFNDMYQRITDNSNSHESTTMLCQCHPHQTARWTCSMVHTPVTHAKAIHCVQKKNTHSRFLLSLWKMFRFTQKFSGYV